MHGTSSSAFGFGALPVQELSAQLTDLWSLMDIPTTERSLFNHITCNISSTVDEVTVPGALALDLIEQAGVEVGRLDHLKASKMKEIAFKKQIELEDIYARAHIEIDAVTAREKIMSIIDSGNVEPSELVADMDKQILIAKEEALSRKEILEKVERWMSACEEESWLEDYNRDENRYSSSRGAHLNLKRAEKARVLVNKIPALVDSLVAKTRVWEEYHDISFMYDGVPLLAMLDEYAMLKHEREEEKRRMKSDLARYVLPHPRLQCAPTPSAAPSPPPQASRSFAHLPSPSAPPFFPLPAIHRNPTPPGREGGRPGLPDGRGLLGRGGRETGCCPVGWGALPGVAGGAEGEGLGVLQRANCARARCRPGTDQKKLNEQLNSEPEPSFVSRPISNRQPGIKKVMGPCANGNSSNGTPGRRLSIQNSNSASRFVNKDAKRGSNRHVASTDNVAMSKEEAISCLSGDEHVPAPLGCIEQP
ncbi:hypothetical protein Taro_051621 [Colocasia esculenta]|uniref:Uncharacterized protein n=1 Tax=Colocasia esculenta TaxID=4460 RepID=A0A843XH22_COLES|nr:hypothetical protein [Colocasia esculenta]